MFSPVVLILQVSKSHDDSAACIERALQLFLLLCLLQPDIVL